MTKTRGVTFVKAFKSVYQAEDYLGKMAEPGVLIHLCNYDHDEELFAICTQSALDGLQEELNQTKKEKP
jgi:hypothetical protein